MAKIVAPSYPKPRKVKDHAIPEETLAKALIAASGRVTHAATAIGMGWGSMHERIEKSPYLQRVKQDCLQKRIDEMEEGLDYLVKERNLGAICFGLKTLGKSRGYTENTAIIVPTEIANSMREMVHQIANYQEERKNAANMLNTVTKSSLEIGEDSEGPW